MKMHFTILRTVEVEAASAEEARKKALACDFEYEGHDEDVCDWDVVSEPMEVQP